MITYFILLLILLLGTGLRFLQLDAKLLWIDEVITALFSLGQGFDAVPVEQVLPVSQVPEIFVLNPQKSCGEIAHFLATQSTHPPLFFCLLHQWLVIVQDWETSLVLQLRAFPAILGVGAIAALYLLNRLAFSRKAGLAGALVMAVSPFAVYLSQEARHYTLPLLLTTLALTCLIPIYQQLSSYFIQEKNKPINIQKILFLCFLWGLLNCLSLYTHYFCLLSITAQGLTLLVLLYRVFKIDRNKTILGNREHRKFPLIKGDLWRSNKQNVKQNVKTFLLFLKKSIKILPLPLLSFLLPFTLYLPWIPNFITHFTSPKTDWLPSPSLFSPIAQTLVGWAVMVITLPVEKQPLSIKIISVLITIIFLTWLIWRTIQGLKILYKFPNTRDGLLILVYFTIFVVLEFLAIIYFLGKDISVAPRYHFIYYPSLCALLGASLSVPVPPSKKPFKCPTHPIIFYSLTLLSSLCVVFNLTFQKPYYPNTVATQFNHSLPPVLMVMAYQNTLEIAVGLSYGLAYADIHTHPAYFALFRTHIGYGYDHVWQSLATQATPPPKSLWVIAPGYILESYPRELELKDQNLCTLDPTEHHRIGFPYQLYRCETSS